MKMTCFISAEFRISAENKYCSEYILDSRISCRDVFLRTLSPLNPSQHRHRNDIRVTWNLLRDNAKFPEYPDLWYQWLWYDCICSPCTEFATVPFFWTPSSVSTVNHKSILPLHRNSCKTVNWISSRSESKKNSQILWALPSSPETFVLWPFERRSSAEATDNSPMYVCRVQRTLNLWYERILCHRVVHSNNYFLSYADVLSVSTRKKGDH